MKHLGRCFYCQTLAGPFETDHVVPTARGGPDSNENKVCCCYACNRSKNDLLPSEWRPAFAVPQAALDIEAAITEAYTVRPRSARGRKPREERESGGYRSYYDTDPFELWLQKANRHHCPDHAKYAAIWVRDTLECAAKIVESETGMKDARLAIEVVKLIDARERYLERLDRGEPEPEGRE